jgi:hypothetical protein
MGLYEPLTEEWPGSLGLRHTKPIDDRLPLRRELGREPAGIG